MKISLFLLCFVNILYSQIQLAGVQYSNFLPAKITNANIGQEAGFQELGVFVHLPKKLKNGKTVLINGLDYGRGQSLLTDFPQFEERKSNKSFQSISYSLTVLQAINPKWNLLIRIKPTIASDFKADLSGGDFLFLGTALATRKLGHNTVLGGGLAYTTQTGEPLVLPVIKFQNKNERHDLDMLLPSRIRYLQGIGAGNTFSIGGQIQTNGGNYHISVTDQSASNPRVFDRLIYSRTVAGLLANVRIRQAFFLELSGGYTIARAFKLQADDVPLLGFLIDNGPFFSVGVSFTPKPVEVGE